MSQPENALPPLMKELVEAAKQMAKACGLQNWEQIGGERGVIGAITMIQQEYLADRQAHAETKALLDFERRRANAFTRRNGEKFGLVDAALAERDQARAELATARAEGLEEFRCDLQTTFRSYGLNSEPIPRDEIQLIVNREVDAFHRNGFPPRQPESAK